MQTYLMSIQQPDGPPPADLDMNAVMAGLNELNEGIRSAGGWVFTGGLTQPGSATVVRSSAGDVLLTDGPYAEGKEHIGGLWIVNAPDLDVVLDWAARAGAATGLPIEVRPFQHAIGVEFGDAGGQ